MLVISQQKLIDLLRCHARSVYVRLHHLVDLSLTHHIIEFEQSFFIICQQVWWDAATRRAYKAGLKSNYQRCGGSQSRRKHPSVHGHKISFAVRTNASITVRLRHLSRGNILYPMCLVQNSRLLRLLEDAHSGGGTNAYLCISKVA